MEAFLLGLAKPDAPLSLQILATTPQGRNIPILYLTQERLTEPAAIRANGRPVVWSIGQQHGNEPAGGEAMLPWPSRSARENCGRCSPASTS